MESGIIKSSQEKNKKKKGKLFIHKALQGSPATMSVFSFLTKRSGKTVRKLGGSVAIVNLCFSAARFIASIASKLPIFGIHNVAPTLKVVLHSDTDASKLIDANCKIVLSGLI